MRFVGTDSGWKLLVGLRLALFWWLAVFNLKLPKWTPAAIEGKRTAIEEAPVQESVPRSVPCRSVSARVC